MSEESEKRREKETRAKREREERVQAAKGWFVILSRKPVLYIWRLVQAITIDNRPIGTTTPRGSSVPFAPFRGSVGSMTNNSHNGPSATPALRFPPFLQFASSFPSNPLVLYTTRSVPAILHSRHSSADLL